MSLVTIGNQLNINSHKPALVGRCLFFYMSSWKKGTFHILLYRNAHFVKRLCLKNNNNWSFIRDFDFHKISILKSNFVFVKIWKPLMIWENKLQACNKRSLINCLNSPLFFSPHRSQLDWTSFAVCIKRIKETQNKSIKYHWNSCKREPIYQYKREKSHSMFNKIKQKKNQTFAKRYLQYLVCRKLVLCAKIQVNGDAFISLNFEKSWQDKKKMRSCI